MLPRITFSAPVLILIFLVALGLIICHVSLPQWYRDTLAFGSALVGGGAAVYALLLNVQARRAASAAHFIERYNDPSFGELRKVISISIRPGMPDPIDIHSAGAILNFFEELAIAVNSEEASDQAARAFFYTIVSKYFRAMEPWISEQRNSGNQPTAYKEYEKLYRRWTS
jgi:hypothetical protein